MNKPHRIEVNFIPRRNLMKILNKFLGLTQMRNKKSNGQSSGKKQLVQI